MQSRVENERRTNLIITDRPDSSQLVDLHVYTIPKNIWKNGQNLAENIAMQQAISAGFVRVPETLTIHDLRRYIIEICGDENDFPKDWIYLRSVGRCLTKVKGQQEKELKVKNFRPPITFSPEIYLLEEDSDDQLGMTPHSSIKPIEGTLSSSYPFFIQHFTSIPLNAARLSARDLLKVREEQERLYIRQLDLARRRQEMEDQHEKEQEAASTIQTAFRNYRHRQEIKQQEADEIERLEEETKLSSHRQAEGENVVRMSHRLDDLQMKRTELEAQRASVVDQIHQLQTQITARKKEEKDLWKKKYLMEKNHTTSIEEYNHSKVSADIDQQLEQAKIRLSNSTKLRQQAEYQSRLLRQSLHEISSTLNSLERYRLPKPRLLQPAEPDLLEMTPRY